MTHLFGARFFEYLHAAAVVVWLLLAIPTMLWWRSSVTWIVWMSLYAIVASHASAWQASRTEVKQDVEEARARRSGGEQEPDSPDPG